MEKRTNGDEIPSLEPKLFYGLSTNIRGNALFINDIELLHPAGKILVMDNLNNGSQKFIKVPSSKNKISEIAISPNKKFVVVGENGKKPTLSIYELSTQKRLKFLGVPLKNSTATEWASIAFMRDNNHLIAVTGHPCWDYLIYDWPRGRVVANGKAASNSLTATQVVPNPEDCSMFVILGPGLFRLMSQSDKIWRQFGFSRADNVPLQVACWLGPQLVLAGSVDGRILLVNYGELRNIYEADKLFEIHLTESQEDVTLASNMVTQDNKTGIHEVRALISFEKGFLYSCNVGEIIVFAKVTDSRWVKKNIIKISAISMTKEEFQINNVTVNPSENKIVCTSTNTELYISDIFFEQDFEKDAAEFHLLGNGYHDGAIASVSTCFWKPIFLTVGLYDKTIRLWNYELMKVIFIKKFTDVIYSASMHPSGFYCLLGFTDKLRFNLILINDLKTVGNVDIRACKNVAFAAGGHMFAATRDINIEIYSAVFFTRLHVLSGHLGPINRLVFGPRDKSLWSCGGEGSLYEWDIDTGERIVDIFTTKNGQYCLTAGEAVFTVGTDGQLKEVINGMICREIDMQQSSLSCVALGNSGQLLFLGGQKGTVTSVLYPLVHPPKWQEFSMHSQPLADVAITHNDSTLISTSSDGFLCIWQIVCSKEKHSENMKSLPCLSEILMSLQEVEDLRSLSKDLSDRLLEIEGQHEYTIRQMTATSETTLRETVNNYSTIVEDLKFKLKQMEREHLVEINKYQTNQKDEYNGYQKKLQEQEQHFSKKLLNEINKTELLEKINETIKTEFERKIHDIEQQGRRELKEATENKDAIISQKVLQIKQLQEVLTEVHFEKDEMKNFLEKHFESEKVQFEAICKSQIKDAEKCVKEITTEHGIMNKQTALMREETLKLVLLQNCLKEDTMSKQKKIDSFKEEIEILKRELNEKESVINDKDKLIVQITKQNEVFNKEIQFRNTTVDSLLQLIAPKDKELELRKQILEKKNSEIYEIMHLIAEKDKQIKAIKDKLIVAEKNIKRNNESYKQIKFYIRKIRFDLYIAASYAYQPKQLKSKILEISEKYLLKHKEEIVMDSDVFKETIRQRTRMESMIKKLQMRLSLKKSVVKYLHTPHRGVLQLISELNKVTSELQDQRMKVKYLQRLLKINY